MFVNYHFAHSGTLPPLGPYLYAYIVAENGLFVRADRPGLQALIPLGGCPITIRGLARLEPHVEMSHPRVPAVQLQQILQRARQAAPREILFYLLPGPPWKLVIPAQYQSPYRVRPVEPHHPHSAAALIEVHSHHLMPPTFSTTDDQDETGFRLYAVFGKLHRQPALRLRVGVYGHFWEIPATRAFELPEGITDALDREGTTHAHARV